jgi:hypothetical protein
MYDWLNNIILHFLQSSGNTILTGPSHIMNACDVQIMVSDTATLPGFASLGYYMPCN